MGDNQTFFIYRDKLLPPSETFIRAQGEGLQRFTPYYVGTERVHGLDLPPERVLVASNGGVIGKIGQACFKLTGFHPGWIHQLRQIKAQLIHAHFATDAVFAMALANQLHLPLVTTCHGYDVTIKDECDHSLSRKFYLSKRRELQQRGNLFIAVSNFIKQKMIEQGFPEDKIIQHYIGIDVDHFTPDLRVKREPIVLFVGRLVEKKGAEYLIRAMSQVQKNMPDVELVVIGDGPLRQHLEKLASGMLSKYRFLGVQSPEAVKSWLNKAMVFSVPSIISDNGDAEGFGMVFAEANAMGVPVVSFASGGIRESVAHEETGFLAPEKDTDQLASYILSLFKDRELWERFSRQGRERVQKLFNLHKNSRFLEEIYSDVINEWNRGIDIT